MSDVSVKPDLPSFFDLYSEGRALPDDIDDFIDRWHEGTDPQAKSVALHEYLGLSRDEYEAWVRVPDILPHILIARRDGRALVDVVNDNLKALPVAARSGDAAKVRVLREWLENRRRR